MTTRALTPPRTLCRTRHLPIDRQQARLHLELLASATQDHIFAVFPERADCVIRPRHLFGRFADLAPALERYQTAGAGIFVTVNAMRGRRRRTGEVCAIRAVFAERDRPGRTLPLAPSLQIETSPGKRHDYLLCDPTDAPDLNEARRINRLIADRYDGDRHACDLARVLRLAGSVHQKSHPVPVRIVAVNARRYSARELSDAFPPPPRPACVAPPIRHPDRYIAAAMDGLRDELARAPVGSRNATLNRVAFRMGQLGIGFDAAACLLAPVAQATGLDDMEIIPTLRSGHAAGSGARRSG